MDRRMVQIGPNQWAPVDSMSGIAGLGAPGGLGEFPENPYGFRRRVARGMVGTPVNDPSDFVTLGGDQAFSYDNTTGGVVAIPGPSNPRNFLGLRNTSTTATAYIGFGSPATVNSWLSLAPGVIVLFDTRIPQDDIYCVGSAAGLLAYVQSVTPGDFAE